MHFFSGTACRTTPIGVVDRSKFPDHRMTATSFYQDSAIDYRYAPYNGRLNVDHCWKPKTINNTPNDYLQLDLGGAHFICAVATQGNTATYVSEWTTAYQISLSANNYVWSTYNESGKIKVSGIRHVFVKVYSQSSINKFQNSSEMQL